MKCGICKTGETAPGYATVTLQRRGTVILIKEVPADVARIAESTILTKLWPRKAMSKRKTPSRDMRKSRF